MGYWSNLKADGIGIAERHDERIYIINVSFHCFLSTAFLHGCHATNKVKLDDLKLLYVAN